MRRVTNEENIVAHMLALEGVERLSGTSKVNGRKSQSRSTPGDGKQRKDRTGSVGRALRTVYDDMLREEVPKDFLDLLRKLG
ncbi:MAG TPA: NepR family anti-sigma factor [Sphingomicrobium sp.]|nr:NepR family anti-sigma factor [Sphingomicrobium sp.]